MRDAADATVAETKYWPYGATRTGGVTQTDKLYTGQQQEPGDAALGLYNYKARFYSTTLGRFVAADRAMPEATSRGLNRYAYAYNSPLRYSDPSGFEPTQQDYARCASDPIACLWWSAGGNWARYYTLVGSHFGVAPALLAAIVWNQASNWKVKYGVTSVNAGIEHMFVPGSGGYGMDDLQADVAKFPFIDKAASLFKKMPFVGSLLARVANPTVGVAQITISLAETLQDLGYAPQLGRAATISALLTLPGAIFYAAANMSYLNDHVLAEFGRRNSEPDRIAAYRVVEMLGLVLGKSMGAGTASREEMRRRRWPRCGRMCGWPEMHYAWPWVSEDHDMRFLLFGSVVASAALLGFASCSERAGSLPSFARPDRIAGFKEVAAMRPAEILKVWPDVWKARTALWVALGE
ncbi:MAG: RHS repeat-associated core domain-containing protein [Chloroflexota bacterium]|nr:RHS repeat-associated core domain-containing protein [Chloroflexota bacterium]